MNDEFKLTKIQYFISFILILFLSITGVTYAYFAISASNSNTISGTAATVNLTLGVERVFPTKSSTNTGVMVPQLSSVLSKALKSGCIDANGNVVCQVYKISIANIGGTATQVVDGSVSFYSNSSMTTDVSVDMPNLKWKLITSVDTNTPNNSVLGSNTNISANFNNNIFADDITLVTNDNEEYYMIIWIEETSGEQPVDEGKSFYGKVEFNSSNGTGVASTFTS